MHNDAAPSCMLDEEARWINNKNEQKALHVGERQSVRSAIGYFFFISIVFLPSHNLMNLTQLINDHDLRNLLGKSYDLSVKRDPSWQCSSLPGSLRTETSNWADFKVVIYVI